MELETDTASPVAGDRTFHKALLPLRVVFAAIWIMGGFVNLYDANVAFGPASGQERYEQLIGVWADGAVIPLPIGSTVYLQGEIPPNPIPGMDVFLREFVAPNALAFISTMGILELSVGLAVLAGAFTRLALVGAIAMSTSIILAAGHTHPGILRVNLLMVGVGLFLLLARVGRHYALDAWIASRLQRWPLLRWATAG
jgi:uncharacterized membrane protein YphA (DoxX/SURF4 family)